MAPGIKIGYTINALAHKVKGSKWSRQRYGSAWKTKELRGTVTSMTGSGRTRKWNCHFEELSISCALSVRSLLISGQDTLPPQQLIPASMNEQDMTGDNDYVGSEGGELLSIPEEETSPNVGWF